MRTYRKWLYVHAFNLVARLAPKDVRAVHLEVFNRGFKAYEEARTISVEMLPFPHDERAARD